MSGDGHVRKLDSHVFGRKFALGCSCSKVPQTTALQIIFDRPVQAGCRFFSQNLMVLTAIVAVSGGIWGFRARASYGAGGAACKALRSFTELLGMLKEPGTLEENVSRSSALLMLQKRAVLAKRC